MQLAILAAVAAFIVQVSAEKFSCEGRASGYYADVDTGCQVYHMCDGLGRQFSYSCPNTTLFQQRMLICDHWYMVNCSKSELDYSANLLIGQRDKPFVEDSSEHPYHRTPRPDLLQQPYAPSYQNDYRQGRAQAIPTVNLVGVATEEEGQTDKKTDRPQYFVPSHWSTEYGKGLTTPIPSKTNNKKNYGIGKNSNGERKPPVPNFNYDPKYYKAKPIPNQKDNEPKTNEIINNQPNIQPVRPIAPPPNIPVRNIPKKPAPNSFVLTNNPIPINLPNPVLIPNNNPNIPRPVPNNPIGQRPIPNISTTKNIPNRPPITATQIPAITKTNNQLKSNFRPDVPDSTNEASVSPSTLALPPFIPKIDRNDDQIDVPKPSIYYQPPKLNSDFDFESTTMDPESFYKLVPSKVLLPPSKTSIDRSTTVVTPLPTLSTKNVNKKDTETTTDSEKRWKELRQMFFIPEYDFPLEAASRPSYESGLSSFQVNHAPPNPERRRQDADANPGVNPECPKCDPAFLTPGSCKPCVMIRR